MFKKMMKLSFLLVFAGLLTACAGSQIYHENFMRGQVVGLDKGEVVVCIGSKDGAEVGQELDVYRYAWNDGPAEEAEDDYQVVHVGTLRIESVVNEHFARAISMKGDVKKNDMVELKK